MQRTGIGREVGINRNWKLDVARGFAIVLVVANHAMQRNNDGGRWYILATVMSAFYMSLFMFVSGYTASYGRPDRAWIWRRFLQLMIPFVAWSAVLYYSACLSFTGSMYPTQRGLLGSMLWTIIMMGGGLWFLPALFAICLVFYLCRGRMALTAAALVAIYGLASLTGRYRLPYDLQYLSLGLGVLAWFLPDFMIGYLVARHEEKLRRFRFLQWGALAAFPALFVLPKYAPIWGQYVLAPWAWPVYPYSSSALWMALYGFVLSLAGVGMAFALMDLCSWWPPFRRLMAYLGTIALGIYGGFSLWLNVGIGTGAAKVASVTFCTLALCVALVWLFRRFTVTDYLFLGGAQRLVRQPPGPAAPGRSVTARKWPEA